MSPETAPSTSTFTPPYRRSYIDVVLAWVERLPGPTWVWFVSVTALCLVFGTGLSWLDGSIPPGTFTIDRVINDGYVIYPLVAMAYLNHTASAALAQFRPALGELDSDYEVIEYRLTTVPRGLAWAGTALGLGYFGASVVANPSAYGFGPKSSIVADVYFAIAGLVSSVLFVVFIFFALRQLSVVVRLHRQATHLSLYETGSHNAFSRLSLRASILLALPVYLYSFIAIVTGQIHLDKVSAPDLIAIAVMVVGASILFIWPLYGMHRRLVREKARVSLEVGRRFESATARLHQLSDSGSLGDIGSINQQLASLVIERDTIKKISTWPWEIETLRGFLSSIALPIVLWIVTTLLGKVLP